VSYIEKQQESLHRLQRFVKLSGGPEKATKLGNQAIGKINKSNKLNKLDKITKTRKLKQEQSQPRNSHK